MRHLLFLVGRRKRRRGVIECHNLWKRVNISLREIRLLLSIERYPSVRAVILTVSNSTKGLNVRRLIKREQVGLNSQNVGVKIEYGSILDRFKFRL